VSNPKPGTVKVSDLKDTPPIADKVQEAVKAREGK
jgi:hypothetical protein